LSGAVFEAPGFVAGLDDLAVMEKMIEQGGGHFGVSEDSINPAEVSPIALFARILGPAFQALAPMSAPGFCVGGH
jgi:hypothetical protein